jgi:hypothetical protein
MHSVRIEPISRPAYAWLRRKVLHPCDGGASFAPYTWPRGSGRHRCRDCEAHHEFSALLTTGWRCSSGRSAGEFPTTQLVGSSGTAIIRSETGAVPADHGVRSDNASASWTLGNNRQTRPNISLSIKLKGLLRPIRRSTLICCLKTRISASSSARTETGRHLS